MPRAEAGSAKALSNKMKSKGLGKLRWYCQICEKQCRDVRPPSSRLPAPLRLPTTSLIPPSTSWTQDNGFQCHIATEGHLRKMLVVGESAGKHIGDYTDRFQGEFVALLSRRCVPASLLRPPPYLWAHGRSRRALRAAVSSAEAAEAQHRRGAPRLEPSR